MDDWLWELSEEFVHLAEFLNLWDFWRHQMRFFVSSSTVGLGWEPGLFWAQQKAEANARLPALGKLENVKEFLGFEHLARLPFWADLC